MTGKTAVRYGTVAMTLHWLIAAAILGMLVVGTYMADLPNTDPNKFALFQLHKSTGITIFALTILRIGWRLWHPVPPLPPTMPTWQRWAAHGSHFLLYALMLGLPLTGWLRVSSDRLGIPTLWYGWFEIPAFPVVSDTLTDWMHETHELLGDAMIVLLIIHVGAALKHHFWDRDNVFKRMLPFTQVE